MTDSADVGEDVLSWGDHERGRLRRARALRGDSQPGCIDKLETLGARRVSQPTLSQWESGVIDRPPDDAIRAIARYCAEAPGLGDHSAAEAEEFSLAIAPITGEPILSDRQARLVDAIISRLEASVGPMSHEDGEALRWAASLLGLMQSGSPAAGAGRGRRNSTRGGYS